MRFGLLLISLGLLGFFAHSMEAKPVDGEDPLGDYGEEGIGWHDGPIGGDWGAYDGLDGFRSAGKLTVVSKAKGPVHIGSVDGTIQK